MRNWRRNCCKVNSKLLGTLGICRRAGHLTLGFDAVCDLIKQRQAKCILLAADLSEKTKKELLFQGAEQRVPLHCLPYDKATLAASLGLQKPVGVIATADNGFAKAIAKHIPAEIKEDDAL